MSGHYENHLNWDLVIVFRYAWPSLDEPTRARVRDEIQRMLDWCLSQSLQADGSFKTSEIDDTLGDAQMYGAWFLRDAGSSIRHSASGPARAFPTPRPCAAGLRLGRRRWALVTPV